jgi:hypothetical protein
LTLHKKEIMITYANISLLLLMAAMTSRTAISGFLGVRVIRPAKNENGYKERCVRGDIINPNNKIKDKSRRTRKTRIGLLK